MNALMYEEVNSMVGEPVTAAGTSEQTTLVADMADYDELEYEILFGANISGAVITLAPKENTASHVSSPTPSAVTLALGATNTIVGVITAGALVITSGAADTQSKIVKICLKKSAMTKRYQFLAVSSVTQNFVIASIIVHRRAARTFPITQHANVIATAYAAG